MIKPLAILLLVAASLELPAASAPYAPDRVIVKFRTVPTLALPGQAKLTELPFARWRRQEVRAGRQQDFSRYVHPLFASVPKGWTVTSLVAALRKRADVEYAEPDFIGTAGAAVYPSDPQFTNQWHLFNWRTATQAVPADIRMPGAWSFGSGSSNIILAILDSGLNTNLPEFVGRTVSGYDFVNGDADPADDHPYGHGSTVASVAAASANNGAGGSGVAPTCRIMPVKVLNSTLYGYYSDWASGILWAITNGARVINLSAGGSDPSETLQSAILSAIDAGAIFVTITHNDGSGTIRFPGTVAEAITIGATDSNDTRATFSNYGPEIDLVAPGKDIRTTDHNGATNWFSGTSFAAPQVAGVACLILSHRPDLRQANVRDLLCASADDQVGRSDEDAPGFDDFHGWGRLNAYAALQLALTRVDTIDASSFRWAAPPNASQRQPYRVEVADAPLGSWSEVTGPGSITYTNGIAQWTDTGASTSAAPRLYRVSLPSPQ